MRRESQGINSMNIIIAGDYCPHNRVEGLLEKGEYESVFGEVKCFLKESDYSIVNLECPVLDHSARPIEKCGPNLKCSSKGIDALKWVGFNCVTLANNHFYDYGEIGVDDTLSTLRSKSFDFVGGGTDYTEASMTFFKQIGEKTLAIINCCEHEFSIATEKTGGANPLNPIRQYYAIREAQKSADYVIAIVHGGFEHYQLPSQRMKETYRFFVDAGADVVVNHHQHCYSGYEVYKGKPIFYGVGNFCFDWNGKRNTKWNEGYMVRLALSDQVHFDVIPYIQCNQDPTIKIIGDTASFKAALEKLNRIISEDTALENANKEYLRRCMPNYIFCFEPFYNKLTKKLVDIGVIPSFIRKRRYALIDYITNESHYEKVKMTLYEAFKK